MLFHPSVDDFRTTPLNTPVKIPVVENDVDPDNDTLNLSDTIVSNPSNGEVTVNDDGTVTYTPDNDFHGVDTFVYKVCDSLNHCDVATVTVLVEPPAVDAGESVLAES